MLLGHRAQCAREAALCQGSLSSCSWTVSLPLSNPVSPTWLLPDRSPTTVSQSILTFTKIYFTIGQTNGFLSAHQDTPQGWVNIQLPVVLSTTCKSKYIFRDV